VPVDGVSSFFASAAALSSTSFVVAYQDTTNSNHPTAVVTTASGTTVIGATLASNTLGMATTPASPGGSVTVASNGIVTGLSALTAGATYYWNSSTGALNTAGAGYKVGIARIIHASKFR
jgi:hypothetical protein